VPPVRASSTPLRLDKWLWSARLCKTRSLAVEQIERGRVLLNDQPPKPASEIKVGDRLELRLDRDVRVLVVRALSARRGPAAEAQGLYEETAESRIAREVAAERRRLAPDPAAAHAQGRPTKRDRRDLADWHRWSASIDDDKP
jgi:ribosome-associated heat shock protein Hsp15